MARRRAIALSGLAAAALVNYWVLAPLIGVDHDPGFSWISDLAARGEAGGWRFALLDGLSGVAVLVFGVLLWGELARPAGDRTGPAGDLSTVAGDPAGPADDRTGSAGDPARRPDDPARRPNDPARRPDDPSAVSQPGISGSDTSVAAAPGGSALRWGLILLIASGALAIADALLPVSCARSLGPGCVRTGDLVDKLHEIESALAVLATGGAMVLIGVGLRRRGGARWLGALSVLAGVAFLLLSGLISMRESVEALNEYKGLLQRGGQLVLGVWLAALALAFPADRIEWRRRDGSRSPDVKRRRSA